MKNLKIITILILILGNSNIYSQPIGNSDEQVYLAVSLLNDHMIFLGEEINVKERKNSQKIIIEENSENIDFSIYSIDKNKEFIENIIELYESLDKINNDIEVLYAFSQKGFYESFKNCDCYSGPFQIIQTYKKSWDNLNKGIDEFKLFEITYKSITSANLLNSVKKVKNNKSKVEKNLINKHIEANNHANIINYISKDVIPINAESIKSLSDSIEDLKSELTTFIIYVQLFNAKKPKK